MLQGRFAHCEIVVQKLGQYSVRHGAYLGFLYNYHLLHGRFKQARRAIEMSRTLNAADPRVHYEHQRGCGFSILDLELRAYYFNEPLDLAVARRRLDALKKSRSIHSPNTLLLIVAEAQLLAIEGQNDAAVAKLQEAEAELEALDAPLRELVCSQLTVAYLYLGDYEEAQLWAEETLSLCRFPVSRISVQEKLATIYEELGDTAKAELLRITVVESGFPIMAVEEAREKLGAGGGDPSSLTKP